MGITRLEAPHQEQLLTVTDVGAKIGKTAKATNLLLTQHGFQTCTRNAKKDLDYEATPLGKPHSRMFDVGTKHHDGRPVLQLRWLTSVVEPLLASMSEGIFS